MTIVMGSQATLATGVVGTLSLGLMRRPPALALRALAVATIVSASAPTSAYLAPGTRRARPIVCGPSARPG